MTSEPQPVRLDRTDLRFLGACVVLVLVGGAIGLAGFSRAFPEASIDFRVTRQEARAIAQRELEARGFDLSGFRPLVVFDHDDTAKVFLERTLGLAKASPLMGTEVPIWRWSIRWVRPLDKAEFRAFVSPSGRLDAYRRILPERAAAPDPGDEAARKLAEQTLRRMRGLDPSSLKAVEATVERRPARVDRRYVWESRTIRFGDAAVRYLVEVQGDRVGRSSTWLEVPEAWREGYQALRSRNQAAGAVATFGLFLTAVALLVTFLVRIRRRDVKWRWALAFGGVGVVLQLASSLNELPIALFDYQTAESWGGFLAQALLSSVGGAILLGVIVFLLVAGGEPLYREAYPDKPALGRIFSLRGVGSKRFLRGLALGYALTACFFAYQVVFYVAADRLGAWAPADVPYSNLLGTRFPWLAVLLMGFLPATTEEFSSRMFSIPFVSRFAPRWVAVLVPALIWGFAHSAYPNQPFWIRGVEVGTAGVVIGALMLRFDVFPLLVWHFTVDALYTSLILVRSSSPYFVVSGALAAGALLLPLVVSVALAIRRGGFAADGPLENQAVGSAPAPPREAAAAPPAPLPVRPVALPRLLAAIGLSLAVLALSRAVLPRASFGPGETLRVPAGAAREAADAFLRRSGDDPARYLAAAESGSALPALESASDAGPGLLPYDWSRNAERWLVAHGGLAELERWGANVLPGPVWQVRYVRERDRHAWWVVVDARSGAVTGFSRRLPDDEPGASLSPEAALEVARRELAAFGLDPAAYKVVSTRAEDRKGRRDHDVVFESRGEASGEARRWVAVSVAGDRPALLATGLKLPEEWVRAGEKSTAWTYVAVGWKVLGLGCVIGLVLVELVLAVRAGGIPWRRVLIAAALLSIPALLGRLATAPQLLMTYSPEFPLSAYAVIAAIGVLVGLFLAFALALAAGTLAESARPGILSGVAARAGASQALRRAAAAVLLTLAARALRGNLAAAFPSELGLGGFRFPPAVDALVPVLPVLADATRFVLVLALLAAAAARLVKSAPVPRWMRAAAVLMAAGVWAPLDARTAGDLLVPVVAGVLPAAALAWAVVAFLGDDPRAYLFAAVGTVVLRGGVELVVSGVGPWVANGAALLAIGALVLVSPGWRRPPEAAA